MNKYILLLVLACFTLIIFPVANAQYIFGAPEYLVYATVVDDWYANNQGKLVVIRGRTALHKSANSLYNELIYAQSEMPDLKQATIDDFVAKNLQSYPIGDFINQRAKFKILKQEEINELFEFKDGWVKFYREYPDAKGLLTFSRVGLNPSQTQALVYVGNQWDLSTGAGVYLLLEKEEDRSWRIKDELNVWNSWILD